MRISKEISGSAEERHDAKKQGRGEFEWCDLSEDDPSRDDLLGKQLSLDLRTDVVRTGCRLSKQGGKWRIRLDDEFKGTRGMYPTYHIAGMLLMPKPSRQEVVYGEGFPILRSEQYGIRDIIFDSTRIEGDDALCIPLEIEIENGSVRTSINVLERFSDIQRLWDNRGLLNDSLSDLIGLHQQFVLQGEKNVVRTTKLVAQVQEAVVSLSMDYEIAVATTGDVLPSLLNALDICETEIPEPVNPSLVSNEELQIKRRCVQEWKRWASVRGNKSAKFRRDVRVAYDSTCLVCGIRLPYRGAGTKAGVDAAHILPWSEYDLDAISNGICLCKLHHWAFDERLLQIVRHDHGVEIIIPDSAIQFNESASESIDLAFLQSVEGEVPVERLPDRIEDWPSREFLNKLETDSG